MLNNQAFEQIGPKFAERGWVFFAPYRRGQGLSASAGPYIRDEIAKAQNQNAWRVVPVTTFLIVVLLTLLLLNTQRRQMWLRAVSAVALIVAGMAVSFASQASAGATAMVSLLETQQLDDHLAALAWLRSQSFVQPGRIATGGNSFGGIVTVLGAERVPYCAGIDAAGGAESWTLAPQLRTRMRQAVRNSQAPIFFFQAANDFNLAPSESLSQEMVDAGKTAEMKIYPAFGASAADGHSFAWRGSTVWVADVFRFLDEHCAAKQR